MSSPKKNKIHHGFRLDAQHLKIIKELPKTDPLTFRTQAEIVDAALDHFLELTKEEQREIMTKYLLKQRQGEPNP